MRLYPDVDVGGEKSNYYFTAISLQFICHLLPFHYSVTAS